MCAERQSGKFCVCGTPPPTVALTVSQLALPPRSPLRGSGELGGDRHGGARGPGAPFLGVST